MGDIRNYHRQFLKEFIELYKSLPSLWKIKSKDYSNNVKKSRDYNKLVEKVKEVEPNATREWVVKKINSIRTSYRKEKNKIKLSCESGEVYVPRLWYYELLDFLENQDIPQQEISKQDPLSPVNTESVTVKSSPEHYPASQSLSPRSSELIMITPPRQPNSSKRVREVDDHNDIGLEDNHDAFACHVAHKLRILPNDQRIYLEKIINDAIFEAELGTLNRNCYIHNTTAI